MSFKNKYYPIISTKLNYEQKQCILEKIKTTNLFLSEINFKNRMFNEREFYLRQKCFTYQIRAKNTILYYKYKDMISELEKVEEKILMDKELDCSDTEKINYLLSGKFKPKNYCNSDIDFLMDKIANPYLKFSIYLILLAFIMYTLWRLLS